MIQRARKLSIRHHAATVLEPIVDVGPARSRAAAKHDLSLNATFNVNVLK